MRNHYDVIVVGARAAGASTALLLAGAGLDVLVLDRGRYGADTLSTHALLRGAVDQLDRWGLLDRIVSLGTPPVRRATFRYAHGSATVPVPEPLYAPRRTVLDPVLVDAAATAGAEVHFGVGVTGLRRDRDGRVVGVHARTADRHTFAVGSRLVVGADGIRSTVATEAGSPITHRGHSAAAFVYGYWSGLEDTGYEWAYRTGGAAGFIPTNDGLTCVFAGGNPADVGRGGPAVFQALLRRADPELADRVAAGTRHGPLRTHPGRTGFLRRAGGAGWALVGDAGSWKDPISAHGLTDALRDAELLARAVLAGDLREYEAVRDRLAVPLLRLSDELAAGRWSDREVEGLLRRLNAVVAAELDVIHGFDAAPVAAGTR